MRTVILVTVLLLGYQFGLAQNSIEKAFNCVNEGNYYSAYLHLEKASDDEKKNYFTLHSIVLAEINLARGKFKEARGETQKAKEQLDNIVNTDLITQTTITELLARIDIVEAYLIQNQISAGWPLDDGKLQKNSKDNEIIRAALSLIDTAYYESAYTKANGVVLKNDFLMERYYISAYSNLITPNTKAKMTAAEKNAIQCRFNYLILNPKAKSKREAILPIQNIEFLFLVIDSYKSKSNVDILAEIISN